MRSCLNVIEDLSELVSQHIWISHTCTGLCENVLQAPSEQSLQHEDVIFLHSAVEKQRKIDPRRGDGKTIHFSADIGFSIFFLFLQSNFFNEVCLS